MRTASPRTLLLALVVLVPLLVAVPGAQADTGAASLAVLDHRLAGLPGIAIEQAIVTYDHDPTSSDVSDLEARGLTVADPFSVLPMLTVEGSVDALMTLRDTVGVRSVFLNVPQQLLLDETVPYVTGDGAAYALDCGGVACDGAGVAIAVIDTGVDGTHPDLCVDGTALDPPLATPDALCPGQVPVMVQNVEVVTGTTVGFTPVPPIPSPIQPVVVEGIANTDETGGHGTHVASIAAGQGVASGRFVGTAPGARLVGVSAGDAVLVINTVAAIDWVIAHRDTYGIRVINNSWGAAPGDPYVADHPVLVASDVATEAGLLVVFSAGNSGPGTDTMNPYSAHPSVLSVAAGDNRAPTATDILAGNVFPRDPIDAPTVFSSVGVPGSDVLHPDIMAPGQFVIAARASTGFVGATDSYLDPTYMTDPEELAHYTTHSGTSMAAPHVSGVAALVWQAALATGQQPSAETIREVLVDTARPFQDGTPAGTTVWQLYRAGYGYLDGRAAVQAALDGLGGYTDGVDDASGPDVVTEATSFGGALTGVSAPGFPLLNNCPGTLGAPDANVPRHAFEVSDDALTMDAMLDWELATIDLELCVYGPGGQLRETRRVESDTVLAALDRVSVLAPEAGTWTVEVRGPAAVAPYTGYTSVLYPAPDATTELALSLTPETAQRQVGEVHALTANVTDAAGQPVGGVAVDWAIEGVGSFLTADEVTGIDGTASAQVTSSEAGSSTVRATSGSATDTAEVTWTAPDPTPALPGRAWGSGHLDGGEHLNLNVRREQIDGPATGHVKYDAGGRFRATNVLDFEVADHEASIVAEGTWDGTAGFVAIVTIEDRGDPGVGIDRYTIQIRAGGAGGSIVHAAGGTIARGNLEVA
ncbi:MAG TPA: S8 family serine peptidase [Nitriliruptorales bacterium]